MSEKPKYKREIKGLTKRKCYVAVLIFGAVAALFFYLGMHTVTNVEFSIIESLVLSAALMFVSWLNLMLAIWFWFMKVLHFE